MSSPNKKVKTGFEVYYIEKANEIVVLQDVQYVYKNHTICLALTFITRPYFGTKKLKAFSFEEMTCIGEV